jgi:tRNA A-37 threonylcarbamoyl transferase component Bud32
MNHLSKEHTMSQYWVCFACSSPTRLDDKDDFVNHTRTTHQDTISEDQIPILTSVCSQTAPLNVRSCPLCRWAETQNGDIDPASLLDHIAKHVHEFSLRALPWPPNKKVTNEESVEKSVVRVEEWFARWPTSDQGHEHRPTINKEKNEEEEDNYFAQNDYFSDDSGHKSMIRDESLSSDERYLKRFSSTDSQLLESYSNSVSSETFLPDWQQLESAKSSHPGLTRHLWEFPAEAATPSHNTTRSNSPPSPGSPEELTIQHQTTAPEPAPSQFFNNRKKNRSSTGLGLRNKLQGITFAAPTPKGPQPLRHRATSVDLETGTQIANKSAHPELTRHPWGFPAEAGTGLKARRMSLNLPDDFTVDVVELHKEFADQSKIIGRRGKTLGKGAMSTVRLMTRKGGSSELYAVKEFRRKHPSEKDEDYEKRVKSEYSIARSLHHPNIVETIRLCTHQGRWNFVMEYCQEGDLFNIVQKGYLMKEDRLSDRLCIFKQLVQGVHYLHNHGIAHRDIRLENILVTSQSKLKITDFGVSEVFSGIHPGLRVSGGQCGIDMNEVRLCAPGICSTMPYIAPEIIAETSQSPLN